MPVNTSQTEQLYSISQVNALTGVPKSTIRFWEKEFSDFLKPLRTEGNQRRYDRDTVQMIDGIRKLVSEDGYTLDGARKKLASQNKASDAAPSRNEDRLEDLAESMSGYLLQKLFDRVKDEEVARISRM